MVASEAIGLALVKNDDFAADMLRFGPNQRTSLHTHPGDHILFVVKGSGWLDYNTEVLRLSEGECYFVHGSTPHRVRAGESGLELLSVANCHRPVDSAARLEVIRD